MGRSKLQTSDVVSTLPGRRSHTGILLALSWVHPGFEKHSIKSMRLLFGVIVQRFFVLAERPIDPSVADRWKAIRAHRAHKDKSTSIKPHPI